MTQIYDEEDDNIAACRSSKWNQTEARGTYAHTHTYTYTPAVKPMREESVCVCVT